MSELLSKISSYNIFNYLLPGTLFVAVSDVLTSYSLVQKDIFVAIFVYYFIGLVISRIGSLVIEPILKKTKFVQFAEYGNFVSASKNDPKINELSESNNMYRTLAALFFALLIFVVLDKFVLPLRLWLEATGPYILLIFLFGMFLFAYRKQTTYIVKRVNRENRGNNQ